MRNLKDLLNNRLVTPNIETSGAFIGFGIVIRADEKNNCCDIKYLDRKSRTKNKKNVQVKYVSGSQWFPTEGSCVELSITQDEVYITGEFVKNYALIGKPQAITKFDTYVNDDGTTGGYII